ncbi:response regulator [Acidimangrovimonas sediminis]|uniref:response regulator n=1 Tax=Acidimangrovimonas sediminis TaxID=2056283 RepID=UPI0011AF45CE|nr:response regulator [Acidimangrovimonas sediminis]
MLKQATATRPHPARRAIAGLEPLRALPEASVDRFFSNNNPIAFRRLLPKGSMLICGDGQSMLREANRVAARHAARVYVATPEDGLTTDWMRAHVPDIDLILVDSDCMGEIEDTIDFCLQVRRATPALPIIMVSSEIRGDDYTCERMMACDVSLKNGFSDMKLEKTIPIAYANNAYYQSSRA